MMSLYLIPHAIKKGKFCQWYNFSKYLGTNKLIGYKTEFHFQQNGP